MPSGDGQLREHSRPVAARWALVAVLLTGSMAPWYTLHLFPILTFGTEKINLLDVLAACAVLLALPAIVRALLSGRRELLWVCGFITYMAIPFIFGLVAPGGAFFAIREARAFPFYALALAFTTGDYTAQDFRRFAHVFVIGTVTAIVAVIAHLGWRMPLPGYPDLTTSSPWLHVQYLEWTVPLVAFQLSLSEALAGSSISARLASAAAAALVAWYGLATAERFVQFLLVSTLVVLLCLPTFGAIRPRRMVLALVALSLLGFWAAVSGVTWLSIPVKSTLFRWSQAFADNSLNFRIQEVVDNFPRFHLHPLFGEGLGGLVLNDDPGHHGVPWRYVSDGYGYLLIKTGLVGLLLYIGMVTSAVRTGWASFKTSKSDGGWPTFAIGLVGIALLLTLNVLSPTVDTPEGAIAFSLFYGMLATRARPGGLRSRIATVREMLAHPRGSSEESRGQTTAIGA